MTPWQADPTPSFSSVRIQRDILEPSGIAYGIRYGDGTIEVDIRSHDRKIAELVKADFIRQNIDATIEKTGRGFIVRRSKHE